MSIYFKDENYTLYHGKMEEVLKEIEENSIDSIITDPPYDLTSITKRFGSENASPCKEGVDGSFARLSKGFMGKTWDGTGIAFKKETWEECLRVLKPGGYLLAFGGTRTFHRMAVAIEDAGFEIRDVIMWLYGSGFPKSHSVALDIDKKLGCGNRGHRIAVASRTHPDGTIEPNGEMLEEYEPRTELGKQWKGWGTALKPAYEPIIVARKPLCGSVADNIMTYGVGAINIDECRVGDEFRTQFSGRGLSQSTVYNSFNQENAHWETVLGRFHANIITDGSEEVASGMPYTKSTGGLPNYEISNATPIVDFGVSQKSGFHFEDEGSAMRYFYCAKASKQDRDEGLDEFIEEQTTDGCIRSNIESARIFGANSALRKNTHPTVKPTDLMKYLIRLVTPTGGVVLDPFNGSGSTGKACMFENREHNKGYYYIGIEMTDEYLPIAKARIDYAIYKYEYDAEKLDEEMKKTGQLNLFDFEE